jgi:hypothetical protein
MYGPIQTWLTCMPKLFPSIKKGLPHEHSDD